MKRNILFVFLVLIFLGTIANAQVTQFPNGSFETGTLTNWASLGQYTGDPNCDTTFDALPAGGPTQGENSSFTDGPYTSATYTTHIASPNYRAGGTWMEGFYFIAFRDARGGATEEPCERFHNTGIDDFNAGKYTFQIDFNRGLVAFAEKMPLLLIKNDTNTICTTDTTTAVGTFTCTFLSLTDFNISFAAVSSGSGSPAGMAEGAFDNFRYTKTAGLSMTIFEEADPFPIDTNFSLTNLVVLDNNNMLVTDATCNVKWDGTTYSMPYNSSTGLYEFTTIETFPHTATYNAGCIHSTYTADANITGTVEFLIDLSTGNKLTVTDLSNVTHSLNPTNVTFFPTTESQEIVYSIQNNYTDSLIIPQKIENSLVDGRQYFIYTAAQTQYDANIWVFNDSLTYGTQFDNPIQKIWDGEKYIYSFDDTILVGQKKFYKLTYRNPYKNYQYIDNSTDWYSVLNPQIYDYNTLDIDSYQISSFSNIRNIFISNIPDIFEDGSSAFEFQFTAWSDQNVTIQVGQTIYDSDITPDSIILTTEPVRYSFTINASNFNSQLLMKSNSTTPITVYIHDYAIVPRGYFTKRLDLFKSNGDFLDLFLVGGRSKKYIQEGNPFKVSAEAYDREGLLTQLKVEGFFDTTGDDINKVSYYITDLSTSIEKLFSFDQTIPAIIDLNGNATSPSTPRNLIIKATLSDSEGNDISEQSQAIKFTQFPYFGGDFTINFFPTEKRKGKKPAGILSITTQNLSTLEGFDIRIFDNNTSLASPDYQGRIYLGSDFNCVSSNCNIQLTVNDFIFEDANIVKIAVTALLNTEYFSLNNPLVQVIRNIYVSPIDFDVLKIYQTKERIDRTYRNDEEIGLVLVAKTPEADPLNKRISVYLTLRNCSDVNGTNCVAQTTRYSPTGFLFDKKFNVNYFFFQNLFLLDNGSLLPDGNYIRFRANVSDNTGITSPDIAVLADKCKNQNYLGDFLDTFGNPIGTLIFLYNSATNIIASAISGCQPGSEQFDKVTTTSNNAQEVGLLISATHSTSKPKQNVLFCVAPDANAIIDKPLDQPLVCAIVYSPAETPIDDFRLRITNKYSDLSVDGSTKQFKEFEVPYELIALNDPQMLKEQLQTNSQTTINSIQQFLFFGLRNTAGNIFAYSGLQDIANLTIGNGLIANVGATFNLSADFNSASVPGVVFFKMDKISVINAENYRTNPLVNEDFPNIDRTQFLEYLSTHGVTVPQTVSKMTVFSSDADSSFSITDNTGSLIIDELPTNTKINQSNLDQNANVNFGTIPAELLFTIQSTMFFNNKLQSDSLVLVLRILTQIPGNLANDLSDLLDDILNGDFDLGAVILDNLAWFIIIVGGLLALGLVFRTFTPSGGGR